MVDFAELQKLYPTVADVRVGDRVGGRVALSGDGLTAFVASFVEDVVYVFVKVGALWEEEEAIGLPVDADGGFHRFGWHLAASYDGNTLIVGDPDDNAPAALAGAAWVFVRSAGVWTEEAKLVGDGAGTEGMFGVSVSISADGDTVIVGDWMNHRPREVWRYKGPSSEPPQTRLQEEEVRWVGSAYVFARTAGSWSMEATLEPVGDDPYTHFSSDESILTLGAKFGASVAISDDGNVAVVCGPAAYNAVGDPDAGFEYFGGAFWTFFKNEGGWAPVGGANIPNRAIYTSGTTGAGNAFASGHQGVYGGGQGASISGDGSIAIISGPITFKFGGGYAGDLWIYALSDGSPSLIGFLHGTFNDQYVPITAVDLSADGTFAVGSWGSWQDISPDDPVPFVYGNQSFLITSGGGWGIEILPPPDDMDGDAAFGFSAAISADGETLLVGGPADLPYAGAAWSYYAGEEPAVTGTDLSDVRYRIS